MVPPLEALQWETPQAGHLKIVIMKFNNIGQVMNILLYQTHGILYIKIDIEPCSILYGQFIKR